MSDLDEWIAGLICSGIAGYLMYDAYGWGAGVVSFMALGLLVDIRYQISGDL